MAYQRNSYCSSTPSDEAKWGLYVLSSLWQAVPDLPRQLNETLREFLGCDLPVRIIKTCAYFLLDWAATVMEIHLLPHKLPKSAILPAGNGFILTRHQQISR